jgi:hypothetical protein
MKQPLCGAQGRKSTTRGLAIRHLLPLTVAIATAAFASSGAFAQTPANCNYKQTGGAFVVANLSGLAVPAGAASAALASAIGNVNTAFLSQQGSAFVSAPANPAPDQPGGGVWARAIGGEVNASSNSASTGLVANPAAAGGVIAT